MKHVSTLFVFALMSSAFSIAFGQESCPNLFDSNSNGAVDIEDFLAVLSLFSDVDSDSDGIWDSQDACIDLEACNYAASPSEPCAYLDVLGACGGGCEGDGDSDGICDDVATSELGLGEGEWLFSRWTDGGVWQGGPTFGTQWDEIPAVILHASDGRLWMIGWTDGYSNGRDDVYLVVAPSPQVGNNEMFTNLEVSITEEAVSVYEFAGSQPLTVYPHPIRDVFSLGTNYLQAIWSLSDVQGRHVLSGSVPTGNACGLSPGMYVLRVNETNEAIPVWVVR